MEAKVDIRKLQVLNDRINQTIEALNQVRLSVHGLGHSGITPMDPRLAVSSPQAFAPPYFPPVGLTPTAMDPRLNPFLLQPGASLQHSPFVPYGLINPYASPYANPFTTSPLAISTPFQAPWAFGAIGGLQHSAPDVMEQRLAELRATDPVRITQTFPYALAFQPLLTSVW